MSLSPFEYNYIFLLKICSNFHWKWCNIIINNNGTLNADDDNDSYNGDEDVMYEIEEIEESDNEKNVEEE